MDSASSELASIRRELRAGSARVREKLEQMIRSSSVQKMLQDSIVTIRNDRYVIPVKQEYRRILAELSMISPVRAPHYLLNRKLL